ncbi:2-dehydropantoate 2-reductase, partial [Methylibium sp.]|uniref:ketopantoate reductase family protein n=1 Tax=Methylibium sp. TaxID=2067992 RepID=UPI00333F73B6
MRVAVVGLGAVGGFLAARLVRGGHRVSALARGAALAAVREHGLRLDEAGRVTAYPIDIADDAAALGPQELVIVAVKSPALAAVAERLAPLLGPDTPVLTAMNGVPWWFLDGCSGEAQGRTLESVDPGGAIARAIPAGQVLGSVVHTSCSLESPGFVKQHFGNRLIVGEPDGSASTR